MKPIEFDQAIFDIAIEAAGLDVWENELLSGRIVRKATKIYAELGYTEEEASSTLDDLFSIVHPDDVVAFVDDAQVLVTQLAPVSAGMLVMPLTVAAQSYPTKPVRVVIVFPPGGSNDITGRIVFQKVSALAGQQFIIDNRGGAAGTIGSDIVAKGPTDGYTVMVQSTTHVANAHLYKKLPFDVLKDFTGVTALARQVGMLVIHPSLPVKTGKDFVALAKKRPGEVVYGSAGNGSFVHLSMALMAEMASIKMIHVPYKGGGPSAAALVAGETQAQLATIGSLISHLQSKRVRPLGVIRFFALLFRQRGTH